MSTDLTIKYDPTLFDPEYTLQPASKFIPEWFKTLPTKDFVSFTDDEGVERGVRTVRGCPGIVKGMTRGFVLPCPFDFYVKVKGTEFEIVSAEGSENRIDVHDPAQANWATGTRFLILKVAPPFSVWGDENVEYMYVNPVMHNFADLHEFQIPTGILEFGNQHSANAFLMVPLGEKGSTEEKLYCIKKGTPLAQYIPITNEKVTIKWVETTMWDSPPQNTLAGMSTWFDRIKYLRKIRND